MRFHHMCVVTRDLDRQIAFWRDLMGFDLAVRLSIPDGEDFGLNVLAPRALMRDTFDHPEARATVALMTSKDGAMIVGKLLEKGDANHGFPYLSGSGRLIVKDFIMLAAAAVTLVDAARVALVRRSCQQG